MALRGYAAGSMDGGLRVFEAETDEPKHSPSVLG
jgi:hypothetical protein